MQTSFWIHRTRFRPMVAPFAQLLLQQSLTSGTTHSNGVRSRLVPRRALKAGSAALLCLALLAWLGSDRQPAVQTLWRNPQTITGQELGHAALRVATWNIHHRRTLGDITHPTGALPQEIVQADLLALNELPIGLCTGDPVADWRVALGQPAWFFPVERRFWHNHLGNGLSSHLSVQQVETVPLQNSQGKGYRAYSLAEIPIGQDTLRVLITHIDRTQDHDAQLQTVLRLFLDLPEPAILLGDLNTKADWPRLRQTLQAPGVVDALASLPPEENRNRIDWILTRGFTALKAGSYESDRSDHPCFWADLVRTPTPAQSVATLDSGRSDPPKPGENR